MDNIGTRARESPIINPSMMQVLNKEIHIGKKDANLQMISMPVVKGASLLLLLSDDFLQSVNHQFVKLNRRMHLAAPLLGAEVLVVQLEVERQAIKWICLENLFSCKHPNSPLARSESRTLANHTCTSLCQSSWLSCAPSIYGSSKRTQTHIIYALTR